MSYRIQIALLFLAPVAVIAVLLGLRWAVPEPEPGPANAVRIVLPEPGRPVALPAVEGPRDPQRPLVVIDAGHGGHDPGASGGGFQEKRLVLELARALRDELLQGGGIRVALTRDEDRFLVVEERSEIARALGADLFLSIHADSAGEETAVSGASVYTLSEQASSEAAARFAARENRADAVNGVMLTPGQAVNSILVELSQRRTSEESDEFAGLILREGEGALGFLPTPRRSAALRVLRAPDVPSVLYEAGFITNPKDAERLASPQGRQRFAEVMARAIRIYFARQSGA